MALAMPTPPSLRAGEKTYEGRLEICAACESLRMRILCAHCGCYVQFRALPVNGFCPHPAGDKWA
ncbi:hypothetical protein FACS189461_5330 [Spirochaetia bacterium]|nr:hypothetical protein FACS189461_5330 [Spirochaetia bacterium]